METDYMKIMPVELPQNMEGTAKTPAAKHLFNRSTESKTVKWAIFRKMNYTTLNLPETEKISQYVFEKMITMK